VCVCVCVFVCACACICGVCVRVPAVGKKKSKRCAGFSEEQPVAYYQYSKQNLKNVRSEEQHVAHCKKSQVKYLLSKNNDEIKNKIKKYKWVNRQGADARGGHCRLKGPRGLGGQGKTAWGEPTKGKITFLLMVMQRVSKSIIFLEVRFI
jgi:hypothetical protein